MALFKKTFITEQIATRMKGEKDIIQKATDWVYTNWEGSPSCKNDVILYIKVSRIKSISTHCGRHTYIVKVKCGTKGPCGCISGKFDYRLRVCVCAECNYVEREYEGYY